MEEEEEEEEEKEEEEERRGEERTWVNPQAQVHPIHTASAHPMGNLTAFP